jgi:hypothetical protein
MPHSDLHKKKRMKNLAVLAAIVAWIAVMFCVTMIRVKSGG